MKELSRQVCMKVPSWHDSRHIKKGKKHKHLQGRGNIAAQKGESRRKQVESARVQSHVGRPLTWRSRRGCWHGALTPPGRRCFARFAPHSRPPLTRDLLRSGISKNATAKEVVTVHLYVPRLTGPVKLVLLAASCMRSD